MRRNTRSLSSGAHSRDPLARNDDLEWLFENGLKWLFEI
jgi:hypothetical protein